jgi:hypothetical protein
MRYGKVFFVTFASALLLLSVMVYPWGHSIGLTLDVDVNPGSPVAVDVTYHVGYTRYSKSVSVVCFPASQSRDDVVYVLADPNVINGTSSRSISGLYDHLRSELGLFGMGGRVVLVGTTSLDDILEGPSATLVFASRTSGDIGLGLKVLKWVREGGVVVGIGNGSAPFLADFAGGVWTDRPEFLRLRYVSLDFDGGEGMYSSETATAMKFRNVAPLTGMVVDDVVSQNGTPIGFLYERDTLLTSAALFKIESGRFLALSGNIYAPFVTTAEDAVASDLAKIIVSGMVWKCGQVVFEYRISGRAPIDGNFSALFGEAGVISVIAFSNDDYQSLYVTKVYAV